jgi:chromate transporter
MLLELFWTFFKIGLFTFGGGYAMIAQIREIVIEKRHWLSEDELLEVIVVAESTPGPIAINLATYVGYKRRGALGSLMATLGVVLPSLCIIFLISLFLDAFMENRFVRYAFVGIQCAVAFLILKAGLTMLGKVEKKAIPLATFSIVFGALIAFEVFSVSVSSILLILLGGLLGVVIYGIRDAKNAAKAREEGRK